MLGWETVEEVGDRLNVLAKPVAHALVRAAFTLV